METINQGANSHGPAQSLPYLGHIIYHLGEEPPFESKGYRGQGRVGAVDEVEVTNGPLIRNRFARKSIILRGNTQDRTKLHAARMQEAKILEEIKHEHAVRLVATYLQEEKHRTIYGILMDPIADCDLEQYFDGAVEEGNRDQMTGWFQCLINGLAYLHGKGIIHRDIKPQNVLVKAGRILFTDFGISTRIVGKTSSSTVIGNPRSRTRQYCAPEVEAGHTRGRSADIFSLAAVFLEMIVVFCDAESLSHFRGKLEFNGQPSLARYYSKGLHWTWDAILQLPGDLPHSLSLIHFMCAKMLATDPLERPDAESLQCCWNYHPSVALPVSSCRCRPSWDSFSHSRRWAIHTAARRGHTFAVTMLLALGAKADTNNIHMGTALHAAASGGQNQIIRLCMDEEDSIDIDTRDISGATPLHRASENGMKGTVRLLLQLGADINARDNAGMTPLARAITHEQDRCAELLRTRGGALAVEKHGIMGRFINAFAR
ncbi:kinase-like domain-containing protein [Aspergillus cavernicola]|uniref:Kinase-like domain-containing protein n=1 Tax=Aspergillus cavernicola TaxID=176166 RepID=A0ABR4IUK4_9EURO